MARFRLKQSETLFKEGLLSEDLHEASRVAVDKAEIQLGQLEDEMEAEKRLNDARLEGLALDAGILDKEREDARRQLRLATTGAPVAGVLSYVFDKEGAAVKQGDVLARIADLGSFRVEARVSDAYASRLSAGQDAWVVIGARKLPGRVNAILPTIEEGTIRFTVALNDPSDDGLRDNLRVDVLVVTGRREDTLKVPRGPFIRDGRKDQQVFVVDGDRAVRRDVVLGVTGDEFYEVVHGLHEGDEVILSDVSDVIHAKEVRLR
jgi:HlyD family secretion protein